MTRAAAVHLVYWLCGIWSVVQMSRATKDMKVTNGGSVEVSYDVELS